MFPGFRVVGCDSNPYLIADNWFLAAHPRNRLAELWRDEHRRDIAHADAKSRQAWVDVLVEHVRPLLPERGHD